MSKISASFKTRTFKVGSYSFFATVIVIALAVAINLLVNALPSSSTKLDITANQLFSISEQTEKLLTSLDQDVTIYWMVQGGAEDTTVQNLLDQYKGMNDRITVIKKDPDIYPNFAKQYTSEQLSNNSLIVESGSKNYFLGYDSIYEYDYSNYYTTGSYEVSFAGESVLTSAIDYVVSTDLPKLYTLSGHGESELNSTFTSAIIKENIEIDALSLLTLEAIPEDADCVLINAPQTDISEQEKEILLTYLQEGGNLFLITDYLEDTLPNLAALMSNYGLTAEEGIVIEGDNNHCAWGTAYNLLPDIKAHTITSPLRNSGYYVLLSIAQGLKVSEDLPDTVSVTELLTTSDSAFSKLAGYNLSTYEKESGDIDGPFALGVAITDSIDDETESHIVWVSSPSLVDEQMNIVVSGGNQDLFINALGWMCERENSISIHSKSLSISYLTIDASTASKLSVLVVGILPLGYLAIGIYICQRRKRQ